MVATNTSRPCNWSGFCLKLYISIFFFDGGGLIILSGMTRRLKCRNTKGLLGVKVVKPAHRSSEERKETLEDELKAIGDSATIKLLQSK